MVEGEDESFIKSTVGPTRTADAPVKTLGIFWNTATEEISFDFTELIKSANKMQATKRSLLQLTAKLFDPLGLLSPFTITMKCQCLCVEKVDWDVELQGNYERMWKDFVSGLIQLNGVNIPRCYFTSTSTLICIQIHAFSDASNKAYATAVYLRSEYKVERKWDRAGSAVWKSRHLVTVVTPAVFPQKIGGQKRTFLPRRRNWTSFGGECRNRGRWRPWS